ncbi:MAG: hypothetical protein IJT23_03950 [Clostridia bacterium]|nr:hypothetical protein [Clostridia bacterium]
MQTMAITANVNYKTADFFKKCGADFGVSNGKVLNRLLTDVSESSVDDAVRLVIWYYEAMTTNNTKDEKIETLSIFTVLCISLVDKIPPDLSLHIDFHKNTNSKSRERNILKFTIDAYTANILNKIMSDFSLNESGAIEKAVSDFLNCNNKIKPYKLVNYMIVAAQNLISPQTQMTVMITASTCIDIICELSGKSKETVIGLIADMKDFASHNKDISDNINILKNTGFYKEKLQNQSTAIY